MKKTPEEMAQEIVIHLHGPDGDSLYHTKNVIATAIRAFVLSERERCAKVSESICQHRKGPRTKCEFGNAPALIAQKIREG